MSNKKKKHIIKNPNLRRNISGAVSIAVIVAAMLCFYYIICGNDIKDDLEAAFSKSTEYVYDPELFSVHFIDVGQANAILIYEPSGKYMAIDCADKSHETEYFSYLSNFTDELEYAVFTHLHTDHAGNAQRLLEEYKIKNIIVGAGEENEFFSKRVQLAVDKSKDNGTNIIYPKRNDEYFLGDARITVLSCALTDKNLNNESLVLKVDYKNVSYLFMADAEEKLEKALLESGTSLDCDVLQVAHHGSNSSTSEEFLNRAKPKFAVISCAKENDFGHPSPATISRLEDANVSVYYTFSNGNTVISTDGHQISVNSDR